MASKMAYIALTLLFTGPALGGLLNGRQDSGMCNDVS